MPAVFFTAPHSLQLRTMPPEHAGPGEHLVRIAAAGVCGTDLHGYQGDNPFLTFPRIPGHELAGIVVDGDGPLAAGTPVVVNPMITCGRCRACRKGRRNCCVAMQVLGVHVDGGFRDELALPTAMLHPLPQHLPLELGALVEPLTIGANACLRGEVGPGDRVLVQGAGAIGLCVMMVAKARGAKVMVADPLPSRLRLADRLGADALLWVGHEDDASRVREFTDWDGADVVIEATGRTDVLRRALDLVGPAGIVVTLAITREALELPVTETVIKKELDLRGSRLNRDLFGEVITLLADGIIDPTPLITHRFPLEQAADAFATALAEPEKAVKVVLRVRHDA